MLPQQIMKTPVFLVTALAGLGAAQLAAVPANIVESSAAQISPRPVTFAAPNYLSNLNARTGLSNCNSMNPAPGTPLASMILWQFDLAACAEQMFTGKITIGGGQNWGENGPLNFRLHTLVTNGHETHSDMGKLCSA